MKRSSLLDQYASFVGEDALAQIYHAAESLAGLHVLHLNTTAHGGGVAELLQSLIPLMQELGVPHTWKVIPLDKTSNRFTAHLADLLQDIEHGDISEADKRTFLDELQHAVEIRQAGFGQADLYFIHDFQLFPLAKLFPWTRPAIWMCHIDTANPDPGAKAFVEQYLDVYNVCVFNTPLSVFKDLPPEKTHVITPTINPFSEKNNPLPLTEGLDALARCGIDTTRPLITQVSRFSNWKNPWQVIDVYRLVKQEIPAVQVALVGAMEASDDVKAMEVLKDLQGKTSGDPDIHLLYDPTVITHPVVNAFQRYSSVILQRSIREGFGLTATEAMWKYQPIIGTSATGLRTQITDGWNGYIADDTEACAKKTLELVQDRSLWHTLGQHAHELVKNHYLLPAMANEYLRVLTKALKMSHMANHLVDESSDGERNDS